MPFGIEETTYAKGYGTCTNCTCRRPEARLREKEVEVPSGLKDIPSGVTKVLVCIDEDSEYCAWTRAELVKS